MRRIRALGRVLVALVAVPVLALALAPSNGAAQDIIRAAPGGWATRPALAPAQITMEVRRAGFEPISRPVQRGPVYVLSARDGDDIDVRLTVDARSGRLLSVAEIGRARYGGYYGYPGWLGRGRPPAPPADIPNMTNSRPDVTAVRRSPPLPRTRPGELTSAVNRPSAAPAQATAPVPPEVAPDAKPAVAPTMVPIAPLE
jgi:hypothetical protein